MAERALDLGFDVSGMAADITERARRYAPIYAAPDLAIAVRLLHRNPDIAATVRRVIEDEMAKLPGGGVGLDAPLFPAKGGAA